MIKKWFRDFLIGRNTGIIPGETEYKNVILRGNLALVGLIVGVSYIFIDHFNGIYGNEPYYLVCCLISLVTFFFIRHGKYMVATILFVMVMNLLIFIFAAGDTYRSGVYIFFIANCLTAFSLFGYQHRKVALIFTAVALILFFYAYWGEHAWLPKRVFNESYIQLEFSINFIVSLLTSIAIVYFLIDVNFHSEKQIMAKNDQLAKANAELDRFVYSASHDMRAPLSSILGLVQLYKLSGSDEEKNKVIALIQNRANKLDDFIREILDYSRNARLALNLRPVNIPELLTEIIEGLKYIRGFENIQIHISKDQEDETVLSDPERLKVILNNLLGNAVKYYDAAKTDSFVNVRFSKNKTSWCLVIEDNGIGIQPDHQNKIFEMFYRANESSEGSGLGLYIAKESAERLSGSISMTSVFRKGSVFTTEFPIEKLDE